MGLLKRSTRELPTTTRKNRGHNLKRRGGNTRPIWGGEKKKNCRHDTPTFLSDSWYQDKGEPTRRKGASRQSFQ